jgi:hypothetical protein
MLDRLISTKAIKTIALVGISKNSGKTTLLDAILQLKPQLKWAVLSTGLDGETQDRLFKTPKPQVHIPRGSLFCADTPCLEGHGSKVSILGGELYSGRKLWYLQAHEDLETEITGPSNAHDQSLAAKAMQAFGAEKVLIDGSLDRKSIAFEDTVQAIILCIGASFGTGEDIVQEIKRLTLMMAIPRLPFSAYTSRKLKEAEVLMYRLNGRWRKTQLTSMIKHEQDVRKLIAAKPDAIYIPTAYTALLHAKLYPAFKSFAKDIIFRHPQCLSLSYKELYELQRDCRISCLIPFRVKLFALNPWAVGKSPQDAKQFRAFIRTNCPERQFIDIMELN